MMTPAFLQELSGHQKSPSSAAEIIRVAGIDAAARLISAWGGQQWPVPVRAGGSTPDGVRRYAALVNVVGEPAAQRIVEHWSGGRISVPNMKEAKYRHIGRLIRAEFDVLTTRHGRGANETIFELGIKYGLTYKGVRNALTRSDD